MRALAARLGSQHVELDAIHWLPGWVARDREEFRQRVSEAIEPPRWVVDGNYVRIRDLVWSRATAIIWLNYSFRIVFWRALRRTVGAIVKGEIIHGNRESIRTAFFSRYGIPWWVVRTYRLRRREYSSLLANGSYEQAQVIVFTHPKDAERFLGELPDKSA